MDPTAALLGALALAAGLITFVNRRHDAKKAAEGLSPDERVETVWAEHGADDDPAELGARLDTLLDGLDPATLAQKSSVIALAIMAARAERFALLPALADRAAGLDGGCGETAALSVLAEACAGDPERARAMYLETQSSIAGCGACGSAGPGRYLMQELALHLEGR
ncbi:MAG: hypothetical protein JNK72_02620 [Myxococcales bacterium]|nr:hypothetical protein [Myxococcales bacterium]